MTCLRDYVAKHRDDIARIKSPSFSFLLLTCSISSSFLPWSPRPQSNGVANAKPTYKPDDLESAITATRRKPRFTDVVNTALHNNFHAELKRKLKEGVDRDGLERYRKSQAKLKKIKDKKRRSFYEAQNERLKDWLEVDTLVMSMADDVLDSTNPLDADGDGVAEVGGALKNTGGDVDPLLPEDERERRRIGERRAK